MVLSACVESQVKEIIPALPQSNPNPTFLLAPSSGAQEWSFPASPVKLSAMLPNSIEASSSFTISPSRFAVLEEESDPLCLDAQESGPAPGASSASGPTDDGPTPSFPLPPVHPYGNKTFRNRMSNSRGFIS